MFKEPIIKEFFQRADLKPFGSILTTEKTGASSINKYIHSLNFKPNSDLNKLKINFSKQRLSNTNTKINKIERQTAN